MHSHPLIEPLALQALLARGTGHVRVCDCSFDLADPTAPRTRLLPLDIAGKAFRMNRECYARIGRQHRGPDERLLTRELDMPLNSPVLLVAGCQDNQESGDGIGNGRFTQELLRVWDEGRFQGDWKTLAERIVSNMPPEQTPRLTLIGREPEMLAAQGPFTI